MPLVGALHLRKRHWEANKTSIIPRISPCVILCERICSDKSLVTDFISECLKTGSASRGSCRRSLSARMTTVSATGSSLKRIKESINDKEDA